MEAVAEGAMQAASSTLQRVIIPADLALMQKCFDNWKFETAFGINFPRAGDTEICFGPGRQYYVYKGGSPYPLSRSG